MNSIYSVGQVNNYIKNMFQQDFLLNKVSIKGEVSNCKYHTSGHIYFSLKDETGALACVMFAGQRKGLAFPMKNGDKVVVSGSVSVYERDGKYQLYAKEITLEGAGLLYERFLALKAELEEMGMFAKEYKQPIPAYAKPWGLLRRPQERPYRISAMWPEDEILMFSLFCIRRWYRETVQRKVLLKELKSWMLTASM